MSSAFLAALLIFQGEAAQTPDKFLATVRAAVDSGSKSTVENLFVKGQDAEYLFTMAGRQGGLKSMGVKMIPAPPGWESTGKYWVVFHTFQHIEADHDPVYPVSANWKLGAELPEWDTDYRIRSAAMDVAFTPLDHLVDVKSKLTLERQKGSRAPIFRLNDVYTMKSAQAEEELPLKVASDTQVPTPEEGDVVRAGSLLVYWGTRAPSDLTFSYQGKLNTKNSDKINKKVGWVTAWWVPSLARLPHLSVARILGPKSWVIRSEGELLDVNSSLFGPAPTPEENQQLIAFRCHVPISYPKVIAGEYMLVAQEKVGDHEFKAFHLTPPDPRRAQADVKRMKDAMEWFERTLGPFPFKGYECYDADTYYGIESYSHTLLQTGITTMFVSHEMAHTYFGGLAPCPYVRDSWNESMTQYVDSVLFLENADQTLERGAAMNHIPVALSNMPRPHEHGSATYMRGAYVLKMLEHEIGEKPMMAAVRDIARDRRGKETVWADLRPYFERHGRAELKWFWDQWVDGYTFPTVRLAPVGQTQTGNEWTNTVRITQAGTAKPFRLRFGVRLTGPGGGERIEIVSVTKADEQVEIKTDFKPDNARLVLFPYTLATEQR